MSSRYSRKLSRRIPLNSTRRRKALRGSLRFGFRRRCSVVIVSPDSHVEIASAVEVREAVQGTITSPWPPAEGHIVCLLYAFMTGFARPAGKILDREMQWSPAHSRAAAA